MSAKWKGTAPKDANGVIYDGTDDDSALAGWVLYRRAASKLPWISLKLTRLIDGKGAANYWLAWNLNEQRFIRSQGVMRVPADVLMEVELIMRNRYPEMTEAEMVDALPDSPLK